MIVVDSWSQHRLRFWLHMATTSEPTVEYNRQLLAEDAAAKGFDKQAWALAAEVSDMSVIRLLRGDRVGPVTVAKIVAPLGHPVERYIVRKERSRVAERRAVERRMAERRA